MTIYENLKMAYYLKPPRGTIPLNRLLELGSTRMIFLFKLISLKDNLELFLNYLEEHVEYSECLIEGNPKDKISHFIVRLACLKSSKRSSLFVEAESMLFKLRLEQMSLNEKCRMLRFVKRHLEDLNVPALDVANRHAPKAKDILAVLYYVVQQIQASNLLQLGKDEWENSGVFINVPFQYALELVSTRSVHLKRGIALVSSEKINGLLQALFSQLLTAEIEEGSSNYLGMGQKDDRLHYLCDQLEELFGKNELNALPSLPVNSLASSEIDDCSIHFPPCMRVLHAKLRQNHRLRHAARINYSLFLKEIGLPVGEAVKFWEHEYSKTGLSGVGQSTKCCHNWLKDKARYAYSVRHLYGLEGSKRCYAGRSCSTLQNMTLGPLEEGGCPFKHFEFETLKSCLQNWDIKESVCNELTLMAAKGQCMLACSEYLKIQASKTSSVLQRDKDALDTGVMNCAGCLSSCKWNCTSGNLRSKVDISSPAQKFRCASYQDPVERTQIMKDGKDEIGQLSTSNNNPSKDSVLANQLSKSGKSFSKPSEFFVIMKSL